MKFDLLNDTGLVREFNTVYVETARHTLSFISPICYLMSEKAKSVNISVLIFPASFSLLTLEKWSPVPPFHWQGI